MKSLNKLLEKLSLVLLDFSLLRLKLEIEIDISLQKRFLINNYSFPKKPASLAKFHETGNDFIDRNITTHEYEKIIFSKK